MKTEEVKLKLRQEALSILLKHFGNQSNNASIYECADECVNKQVTTSGLVNYYKAYYSGKHDNT